MRFKSYPADDRLARFTFQKATRAAGLFREYFFEELTQSLDLSKLKRIPDQHVSKHLKERRDDLNFECPLLNGGHVLIRILIEHKSAHDSGLWMQLQESILSEWRKSGIRPVIPVVLHTGPEPFWLEAPLHHQTDIPQAILQYLPSLQVVAIDISTTPFERILESQHLDEVSRLILGIIRIVQQKQVRLQNLLEWVKKVYPNSPNEEHRQYLEAAIIYINYKSPISTKNLEELRQSMNLAHPIHPKSPFAKNLKREFAEGIKQGKNEGFAKGLEQGITLEREKSERLLALEKIQIIEGMLQNGLDWPLIEKITQTNLQTFQAMQKSSVK